MAALETYLGQVYISNKKLSKSFVSLQSEKMPDANIELYAIVEVPVQSVRKWPDYEEISKILTSSLKQNFRRPNENSFENAIAQINEDLSKIITAGNSSWVGKLNSCVAARQNQNLFIATAGKIQAYLYRNNQLIDLADSPEKINPLKTFENFAVGTLKKGDFAILSTPSLFNYVALERFKKLLTDGSLTSACENIAETMKEIGDQTVSFGTFILEFQAPGYSENAIIRDEGTPNKFKKTAITAAGITGNLLKKAGTEALKYGKHPTVPKITIPKIDAGSIKAQAKQYSDIKKIKALPRAKKFFLASAAVFFLLLVSDLAITVHAKSIKKRSDSLQSQLNAVQNEINQANISAIYSNNPGQTLALLNDAQSLLNKIPNDPLVASQKSKTAEELVKLLNSAGHVQQANPNVLAQAENGADRIAYSGSTLYLINSSSGQTWSYDTTTNSWQNFALPVSSSSIVFSKAGTLPSVGLNFSSDSRVISTKNNFFIMDPSSKKIALLDKRKSSLLAQYASDKFSDLKDIAVDETGKVLFILSGSQVLTFHFG